jgi:DNA helicase-2/ATP-dependent DNA helicase PcrA
VAITRAKKSLTISHARQRMLYGRTNSALASRFLREIPESVMVKKGSIGYSGFERRSDFGFSSSERRTAPYGRDLFASAPKADHSSAYSQTVKDSGFPELNKGDMVLHTAFGKGLVLSAMKLGNDCLLEIAFDQIGTKKLMAKTASRHMKKL